MYINTLGCGKKISRNIFSFLLLAKCLVFQGLKITYYSNSENYKSSFNECLGLQKCRDKNEDELL